MHASSSLRGPRQVHMIYAYVAHIYLDSIKVCSFLSKLEQFFSQVPHGVRGTLYSPSQIQQHIYVAINVQSIQWIHDISYNIMLTYIYTYLFQRYSTRTRGPSDLALYIKYILKQSKEESRDSR